MALQGFEKTKLPLTFVIVGAGLGGVTASICLRLAGHKVKLLEAAKELGEVGAGIQIPPPSTKILDAIGCLDEVSKASVHPKDILVHRYTGEIISQQNLIPHVQDKYQGQYLHIHRADYHSILVNRAHELGVEVYLDSKVIDIDFKKTTVTTENGVTHGGDIIVGYDGVRSTTRNLLTGRNDGAYDTGDLAYRALIDVEDMKKVPGLERFYQTPNITFHYGPNIHVVIYFLHSAKLCNVVVLCPDTLQDNHFREEATKEELIEMFKDWDQDLTKIFNLIKNVGKWKLQDSRELDTWVHREGGNVIILGDASHSTLPYLASGASQAVEDAAVLAGLFSKIESRDQIQDLLYLTENLRKWRSSQVVKGSKNCQNIYHLPDGPKQQKRDALLAGTPSLGYPNRFADPVFQDFLWGYNAFDEIERAWGEYKKGIKSVYTYPNLYLNGEEAEYANINRS
ncbi:uncharacterized protein KGF55_004723 [Candida pseudojiufengensis]|uniref:uncharacterized protein n=1 Tax=Candida pseudojiufengensis TaxID=497109 RepID=UPI0022253901|nr:uncharacterized protein KGF55_004723 [Candida pseudojiufengensis]KAI5960431.1 hypothetical protein KGF55_004723 [Candida pseudojiufengensis]